MPIDKRKHSALSSTSDLDSSLSANNISSNSTPEKTLNKKQRKAIKKRKEKAAKKLKVEEEKLKEEEEKRKSSKDQDSAKMASKASVEEQLKEMNLKLRKVVTKDDSDFLKNLVKDVFKELKDELMSSFTRQIEVIESELHNKAKENESLRSELKKMKGELQDKTNEIRALERRNELNSQNFQESINDQEQYSRKNNIRITNIPNDYPKETSEETTKHVIDLIKNKMNINITPNDIDIAHRVGQHKQTGQNRPVIVRFVRRQIKGNILSERKKLKGSKIFINEDLTKINNEVLASTRKKQPDEVERSWSVDGKIFIKWKIDSSIEKLKFADYKKWLELPWPISETQRRTR